MGAEDATIHIFITLKTKQTILNVAINVTVKAILLIGFLGIGFYLDGMISHCCQLRNRHGKTAQYTNNKQNENRLQNRHINITATCCKYCPV